VRKFTHGLLDDLSGRAMESARRRQHENLHRSFEEPCQILLNAIGVGSYIRPHRHLLDPRRETLLAVRGSLAVLKFDDKGAVLDVARLLACSGGDACASVGVEMDPDEWHTVIALREGSVLLEVKAGPFDPEGAKEFAPWAPAEGSKEAADYFRALCEEAMHH
jgi:cupin fold WbuC family metalloprotein